MNVRYRWGDIATCALVSVAVVALAAALFEGIPA